MASGALAAPGTWPESLRALPLGRPGAARGRRASGSGGSTARRWSSGARRTPTCRCASAAPTPSACRDAELVELEGAGHWPWLERPDAGRSRGPVPARLGSGDNGAVYNPRRCASLVLAHQRACFPKGIARRRRCSSGSSSSPTTATRSCAGSPTRARFSRVRQRRPRDRPRELARHLLRARLPAGADPPRAVADRLRQLHVPELPLRDHDRLPGLALPVPQRALLLRPQHVHGRDGPRPGRLRAVPDRPAADASRASASPTRSRPFTGVAQDSQTASLLVNKYAAVPSMHIAFSLMIAVPGRGARPARVGRARSGPPIRCSSSS